MNEKEFFEFGTMSGAFGYLEKSALNMGVMDYAMAICVDEHIAMGAGAKYRVPKILPQKACIIPIPASIASSKAVATLATSLCQIEGVEAGVSPSGALFIAIYKPMTDTELVVFGMQAGEALGAMKGLEG